MSNLKNNLLPEDQSESEMLYPQVDHWIVGTTGSVTVHDAQKLVWLLKVFHSIICV